MGAAAAEPSGDDEWEICNDHGFVFKRRRRRYSGDGSYDEVPAPPPPAEDAEAELRRHRRDRRRRCLLALRDKYRSELEQWERLSSALLDLAGAPAAPASTSVPAGPSPPELELPEVHNRNQHQPLIDDLLFQVEAQEAILRKLSEICGYVESLCKEKEDTLVESLIKLPIWGSPRTLMTSLSD